jgi:beta-lactamase class A
MRAGILIAVACVLIARSAAQEAPSPHEQMDRRIRSAIAGFQGKVCLYAKNLDSGETYGIREDERVRTASTIKLAIMATIFDAVSQGRAKWTGELTLRDSDKVSGTGVARELSDGDRLNIRDLTHLMIVVSDNTATNMLLDRFTADAVNAYMAKLGFEQTRSLRKILGDGKNLKPTPSGLSEAGRIPANKPFGIGVSTPREMAALLEKMERGQVVSPEASREMIEILKRQQYKDGIGRRLDDSIVASKSGSLDRLRSDVGIVDSPGGRVVIAITVDDLPKTDYSPDNAGLIFISDLTGMLLDGLARR